MLTQVEDDVEGQCHYRIHGSARMILNTKHGQLWIDVSDEGVNVFVYKDGGFHEYMFMAGEFG